MKKNIKLILMIVMVLLIPTGFTNEDTYLKINKDGSVDYKVVQMDKKNEYNTDNNIIDQETISYFLKRGVRIAPYEDDNYVGTEYSVHYDSFDQIASIAKDTVCTIDPVNFKIDNQYCFSKDSDLLKYTYTAKILLPVLEQKYEIEPQIEEDEETDDIIGELYFNEKANNKIHRRFILTSNNKIESTNGKQEEDKYIWDTDDSWNDENEITFTFVAVNKVNIIIAIVSAVIIIFLTISVIISLIINKNKDDDNKPIKINEEILEMPKETNPVVNALLSEDGSQVTNLNNK